LRGFCVTLVLAALLPIRASALTVDELDLGEHIRGPHFGVKDLSGKVVLIDLWGVRCGPCIAQMPAMQELYKKYRSAGFHIIALEKQADSFNQAIEFFATNPAFKTPDYEFDFCFGSRSAMLFCGPPGSQYAGRYIPELPANLLFNPDGVLIGTNLHGTELEAKVQEALVDALADITKPGEIGRLADIEAKLKSGSDMMVTLTELVRRKKETTDAKVLEEASKLFTAVFAWANKKYDKAMAEKDSNPMAALAKLKTIARQLRGTAIGDKAAKALDDLKNDERVQKAKFAADELRMVLTQISDLKPTLAGSRDPADPEFRRVNAPALRVMASDCQRIIGKYPGNDSTEHVKSLVEEFHLKEFN